jgi:hypothetical protein
VISNKPIGPVFCEGDEVVLAEGTYQGTLGRFLRLRDDVNWADIAESNGRTRCHPVVWLAHRSEPVQEEAVRGTGSGSPSSGHAGGNPILDAAAAAMAENESMRKTIVPAVERPAEQPEEWLPLRETAFVEVTSEDPDFPIEQAFACPDGRGWRAAAAGDQRIRITLDAPAHVHRIQLRFRETAVERTQEFTLRWFSADATPQVIVRQQWNFSPAGSTVEFEDYRVDLEAVSELELTIRPALAGDAVASLDCWRIA